MTTVRISGNLKSFQKMEWVGAPAVSDDGRIDRTVPLPEEAYAAIERQIAGGASEGAAVLADGRRFDWLLDGQVARRASPAPAPTAATGLARLQALAPEIDRLARGELDGSEQQRDIIRLLALVVQEVLRSPDAASP